MNFLYHWADQFCVRNSDETWNLSERMEQARKDYFGFKGGLQKVVPVGVWLDRIKIKSPEEIEEHTAVFMGHITKKQGVQYVIRVIPQIIKEIPDFKLLVIGDGEYLDGLKNMVQNLRVSSAVIFTGFVDKAEELEAMITECAIAIALYEKYDDNKALSFTYYADPAKLKMYQACGLPVITSDFVKQFPMYFDKDFIISLSDSNDLTNKMIRYMKDGSVKELGIKAREFAATFNWPHIFREALRDL